MKRLIFLVALTCAAQTKVDYPTQIKGGPIMSDAATSTTSTLASNCTAAVNAHSTLSITKQWTNVPTSSCAASLSFNGGKIQPANGATVTLSPNTECQPSQYCFDVSAGGQIAFSPQPPTLSPVNFGADITGGADSSVGFAVAWKAAAVTSGGKVFIPCGNFKFTQGVTFVAASQESMLGSGTCTFLSWAGANASATMLLFPNCSTCEIGNFYINVPTVLGAAVQTANMDANAHTATQDIFRNITIQGLGNVGTCFLLDGPIDGNNDQQRFVDDHCFGYTSAGWQLGNATSGFNVFNVLIEHSGFCGSTGKYGVWLRHGNFHWTDGDGGCNNVADFEIDTNPSSPVVIENAEFENSKQFLVTLADGSNASPIVVRGVTWDGSCLQQTPAEILSGCHAGPLPGDMMSISYNGPFTFTGNRIGASASLVKATIALNLDPTVFGSNYIFTGNIIGTTAVPDAFGTVTTSGTAITWSSGMQFSAGGQWNSQTIRIAGVNYTVASCSSATACTLTSSAGTNATPVAYSVTQTIFNHMPTSMTGNVAYCHNCSQPTRIPDYSQLATTFAGNVNITGSLTTAPPAVLSWTPTLTFGGGSSGVTYAARSGVYFVSGGITYIGFTITLTSKGSSTGVAQITGLPSTSTFGGTALITFANDFSGLSLPILPFILNGASYISLGTQGAMGAGGLTDANFTNASNMYGTGWYK